MGEVEGGGGDVQGHNQRLGGFCPRVAFCLSWCSYISTTRPYYTLDHPLKAHLNLGINCLHSFLYFPFVRKEYTPTRLVHLHSCPGKFLEISCL